MSLATTNLRLSVTSPCINAGNNAYAPTTTTPCDLGGNPRIIGGTVDMGAYEFQPPFLITAFQYNRAAKTMDVTFTSDPFYNYTIESSTNLQAWSGLGAPVPRATGAATTTVPGLALPTPAPDRLFLRVRRPVPAREPSPPPTVLGGVTV